MNQAAKGAINAREIGTPMAHFEGVTNETTKSAAEISREVLHQVLAWQGNKAVQWSITVSSPIRPGIVAHIWSINNSFAVLFQRKKYFVHWARSDKSLTDLIPMIKKAVLSTRLHLE